MSYAMNSNMFSSPPSFPLIPVSKLDMPGTTVVFFETSGINGDPTAPAASNCAASLGGCWYPPYSANGCNFSSNYWPCAEHGGYLETGPMAGTCSTIGQGNGDVCQGGYGTGTPTLANGNPIDPAFPLGRHLGGSCFTFADGHAKWLVGSKVSTGAQYAVNGVPQYGASWNGNWWADSPKVAQPKGMATFAYM
jgi:prepilin-type processing-associated H-X9-DG protein